MLFRWLIDFICGEGIYYQVLHSYELEHKATFPRVEGFDALIIGPTQISANDLEGHEFLRREWRFLGDVLESRKPTLGICYGGRC